MYPSYETIRRSKSNDCPFIEVYQISPADLCQFTDADKINDKMLYLICKNATNFLRIKTY